MLARLPGTGISIQSITPPFEQSTIMAQEQLALEPQDINTEARIRLFYRRAARNTKRMLVECLQAKLFVPPVPDLRKNFPLELKTERQTKGSGSVLQPKPLSKKSRVSEYMGGADSMLSLVTSNADQTNLAFRLFRSVWMPIRVPDRRHSPDSTAFRSIILRWTGINPVRRPLSKFPGRLIAIECTKELKKSLGVFQIFQHPDGKEILVVTGGRGTFLEVRSIEWREGHHLGKSRVFQCPYEPAEAIRLLASGGLEPLAEILDNEASTKTLRIRKKH